MESPQRKSKFDLPVNPGHKASKHHILTCGFEGALRENAVVVVGVARPWKGLPLFLHSLVTLIPLPSQKPVV